VKPISPVVALCSTVDFSKLTPSAYPPNRNVDNSPHGVYIQNYVFLIRKMTGYGVCHPSHEVVTSLARGLRFAALAYSALGVCFSIYFMYLQIAFIHAFCIYCLVSAVTTLLLFIAALSHFRATRAPTR
jgi:uncharacterized membrane protein